MHTVLINYLLIQSSIVSQWLAVQVLLCFHFIFSTEIHRHVFSMSYPNRSVELPLNIFTRIDLFLKAISVLVCVALPSKVISDQTSSWLACAGVNILFDVTVGFVFTLRTVPGEHALVFQSFVVRPSIHPKKSIIDFMCRA